jgi:DNA-binding NtrC family response regulator
LENRIQLLVVEDEAILQVMLEDALKEGGFDITVTSKGHEAILILERPNAAYRALITDVTLADKTSGWEVAKRARELHPDFPVVYTSGGGVSEWSANGVPNSVLVAKPFAVAQVVTAVSQLLNQGNTPGA